MTAVITEIVSPVAAVSHAKPSLEFVSLNVIDFLPQVRTASGLDEEELQELAESLKAQGMLQPVLLRPVGDRFALIAGERRCRAAHLAGFSHVPALIGEADDARANILQLVENVQREDLSLMELAAGLRALADQGKTLSEICQVVQKSKSWVSKHLAASVQNLGWNTRQFMESEATEDLELVLVVNQIEKTGKWYPRGTQLVDRLEAGKAGRDEARALLATLKEELAAEVAQKKADKKAAKQGSLALDGEDKEPEPPKWNAWDAERDLNDLLTEAGHAPIEELIQNLTKAQQAEITGHYKQEHSAGKALSKATDAAKLRGLHKLIDESYDADIWKTAAFILGASGLKLTLQDLASEVHTLMHGEG
jgi:ParB/RepB/Spo0J family partition protein